MQIEPETALGGAPSFEQEILVVFEDSLALVHSTYRNQYHLEEKEARALEGDLAHWFERFCQRPGAPRPRDSRHSLLVMACVFARGHQRHRIDTGERPAEARLERVLQREPADVAREASRHLKVLYHKLHTA